MREWLTDGRRLHDSIGNPYTLADFEPGDCVKIACPVSRSSVTTILESKDFEAPPPEI